MAVYRPCAGVAPEAMAKAIASGMATMPTTTPATTLGTSVRALQQAGAVRFEEGDHACRLCRQNRLTMGRCVRSAPYGTGRGSLLA